ncbi:ArdC-like ssDNA-binding domain-containing protein [Acidithiobacillus sp. IBUN Pt1247-S3]|uniref:ArdC-like ssDNA-binding domain-containing protein n=1 Tax=Acidithiobacillus sp. IBUN Pt1247-S3 TaxID=3166642 RepID=UPI0034E596ED
MASHGKEGKRDFRLEVADHLIQQIEQGTARWQKPWKAGEVLAPANAVTGKPYRGVNQESLMMFSPDASDPRWCTYKQAQEKGWQVRKGEHGTLIEKWMDYEHKLTADEKAQSKAAREQIPDPERRQKAIDAASQESEAGASSPQKPTRCTASAEATA